jgi:hypothetical protein
MHIAEDGAELQLQPGSVLVLGHSCHKELRHLIYFERKPQARANASLDERSVAENLS